MKELVSILENRRFEVIIDTLSNQVKVLDKLCSCILLSTATSDIHSIRMCEVFAELLDQRCILDSDFNQQLTLENDECQ